MLKRHEYYFKKDRDFPHICDHCGFAIEDHSNMKCPERCIHCRQWTFDCKCNGGLQ